MPTIFQDRCGISLYDAQHSIDVQTPIPSLVMDELTAALLRFQRICQDFGVLANKIRVVATEATRNAINRDDLLRQIREQTGWGVELLAKEEEGKYGTLGIASSVAHLDGICVDMGGGSVQLTWVTKKADGLIDMGPSVSFPYGAAALMSRLSKVNNSEAESVHREISSKIQHALEEDLHISPNHWEEAKRKAGFNLYLSGGGFRGWGYILMSQESVQPYPIPIINGYSVSESHFYSALDSNPTKSSNFRISSRRASQIPAVQAVIKAIRETQLPISRVTFAQGGVREGLLYSGLPDSIRTQNPLVTSTTQHAPQSAAELTKLLRDAVPFALESEFSQATTNLLYLHGPLPKDNRVAAALRCTTTGALAGVHGLSHRDRCLLALILCERWGGQVSASDTPFLDSLEALGGPLNWWMRFIGRTAKGIADLFPAGVVRSNEKTVSVQSGFPPGKDESSADRCWVKITVLSEDFTHGAMAWATDLEKIGKKKNWMSGRGGLKVDVEVISNH